MGWDLNFAGTTVDDVDKSGGDPPNDYYLAELVGVSANPETGAEEFKFKIDNGVHSGRHVRGVLWNPRFSENAEMAEKSRKRANLWAVRLGLVGADANGKTVSVEFSKAIGWKGIIKKCSYASKNDPSKEFHEIDKYGSGIYRLDSPDVDGQTRTKLGLPLLPGQSATDPKAGKAASKGGKGESLVGTASGAPGTPPVASADDIAKSLFGG